MSNTNAAKKMDEISKSNLPPIEAHLAALGKGGFKDQVLHAKVITMTYCQPEKTQGGIFLPDQAKQEDRFQGKIGLVVAVGPGAFVDGPGAQFYGLKAKVGDWVMTRPADGMEFFYNGNSLRVFEDVNIISVVSDPTKFW